LKDIQKIASTVPSNGDVNPYGVAVVPQTTGALVAGDILVSNFNNSKNLQGTGSTVVAITPGGGVKLFAHIDPTQLPGPCPGGVGLTTALVVLRSGWVIVGSLPAPDGTAATAQAGCLIVLNRFGQPVETFSGGEINGPWDMTALDLGRAAVLFVTNVLNGTVAGNGASVPNGTVLRIVLSVPDDSEDDQAQPREMSRTVIGSGFDERTDPSALVIGPTGLGLGEDGTLYVADTLKNRIAAIHDAVSRSASAGTGNTVSTGKALNGPLGLAVAPNDNILTVNANDGNMVETTPAGMQVAVRGVDATGAGGGTLFGLAVAPDRDGVYFVNDGNNALYLLHR
jgi:Gluconolactonase